MGAEALLCSSCGATLKPRVLESTVKCEYCETVFTIVRDSNGLAGVSNGQRPAAQPAAAVAPALSDADRAQVERLERDAALAVRGLEAVAETAYVARRAGCLGALLVALAAAAAVVARLVA